MTRDHHIGMIVPSSNLTMETELPRMLRAREDVLPDDRFVFHAARARIMRQDQASSQTYSAKA